MSKNLLQVNKLNKLIIIIFLIIFLLPVASAVPVDTVQRKQIPVMELIDLLVDGSITPVRKNLTRDYDFITKLHFELDYTDNEWIPSNFAAGNPLTNGTATISGTGTLFGSGNFTKNDRVYLVSDYNTFIQDDKSPKITHIYGIINLFEIMPPYGLSYTENDSLYFIVQDDITAVALAVQEFQVLIQGFKWDDTKPDVADLVNPFDTMNIWFVWFLSMWPLWLITILILAVFIYILKQML